MSIHDIQTKLRRELIVCCTFLLKCYCPLLLAMESANSLSGSRPNMKALKGLDVTKHMKLKMFTKITRPEPPPSG